MIAVYPRNHDKADRRKLMASIKRCIDKKIVSPVRTSEDRYEITPVIRYVVSADFLETMLVEYKALAGETL